MKRAVMMTMMAVVVSAGMAAAQEGVSVGGGSPVQGGKIAKPKTMTAEGQVKTVAADSLAVSGGSGKDWTFVIDPSTKIIAKARHETVNVGPVSPVDGGKKAPGEKPESGKETVDVGPVSPVEGGKQIPAKPATIEDVKEGQRVQVKYHTVDGKMHATEVRVM